MADSSNSYTHAFYMAGAAVLAGACVPFLLLFTKRSDPASDCPVKLVAIHRRQTSFARHTLHDQEQGV